MRIADLRRAGEGVRAIARELGRSAATVSRELRRNVEANGGAYRPHAAQRLAVQRRARPKAGKLVADVELREFVQGKLKRRWSPEQIAQALRGEFPGQPHRHVVPETIYQAVYRPDLGGLCRELPPRRRASLLSLTAAHLGRRAAQILESIRSHPDYERLTGSSMRYSTCWATFTGYPTVSNWDLERDAAPLLEEALRVLALKAAVFELSGGDEAAAELLCPPAVDEMIHACLAQFTVMSRMQADLGVVFPHATELERFTYARGCDTDAYAAAGWGQQPTRYWLDTDEVNRRLAVLNECYQRAGLGRDGRSHRIDFDTPTEQMVPA